MVTTSTVIEALCAIDANAPTDRYRFSPIAGDFAGFTGEVRPEAGMGGVVNCSASVMGWHRGTNDTTVFGGFDKLAVDMQSRVGPPPPSRPSV
jgi:hypothetical protein